MPDHIKSNDPTTQGREEGPKPVKFIHEKSAGYRIYHADGGWGAISNSGNVQIDFCIEHPPTPKFVIQPVDPNGAPTGEPSVMGVVDNEHFLIVRDFQFGVVLSYSAAQQIHALLGNYLDVARQQLEIFTAKQEKK